MAPIARHEFGGASSPASLDFAPIGLTNMLNSGGAVGEVHVKRAGTSGSTAETSGGLPAGAASVLCTRPGKAPKHAPRAGCCISRAFPPPVADLPPGGESPEELRVHLAVRGRGTLLAYSSLRPQVGRVRSVLPTTANGGSLRCQGEGLLLVGHPMDADAPAHPSLTKLQACYVDSFEVQFEHEGNRLTVQVPQVGSLHAGRSEQELVIAYGRHVES